MNVEVRPALAADVPALLVLMADPGVQRWWAPVGEDDLREQLPTAFAIVVEGELAGWLQCAVEDYWQYPSVAFDIAVADRFAGRGVGPEALRQAVAHFAVGGHHRFVIAPLVRNEAAVRAYEKAGFTRSGVLRKASRVGPGDPFEDELLMELILEPGAP